MQLIDCFLFLRAFSFTFIRLFLSVEPTKVSGLSKASTWMFRTCLQRHESCFCAWKSLHHHYQTRTKVTTLSNQFLWKKYAVAYARHWTGCSGTHFDADFGMQSMFHFAHIFSSTRIWCIKGLQSPPPVCKWSPTPELKWKKIRMMSINCKR